jgi:hypothetical protein
MLPVPLAAAFKVATTAPGVGDATTVAAEGPTTGGTLVATEGDVDEVTLGREATGPAGVCTVTQPASAPTMTTANRTRPNRLDTRTPPNLRRR